MFVFRASFRQKNTDSARRWCTLVAWSRVRGEHERHSSGCQRMTGIALDGGQAIESWPCTTLYIRRL